MSVAFARAVAEGLRYNGIVVHFWPDWERLGNGQTSNYQGLSVHHTGSPYGFAYATLANGRPDLSGPLCNSAGNVDGSITIMAAHPANHAGASGGPSMGPLPVTGLFNRLMWGHEIVYPGAKPMTAAQYRAALILAAVISGILRRPNTEWARGHGETSVTGKWDPGWTSGRMIDMARFRADVWPALHAPVKKRFSSEEDDTVRSYIARGNVSEVVFYVEEDLAGCRKRELTIAEWHLNRMARKMAHEAGDAGRVAALDPVWIEQKYMDQIPKV